jgi:hypothetical protein
MRRGVLLSRRNSVSARAVANVLLLIKLSLPRNRNGGSVANDFVAIGPRGLAVLK